MALLEFQDLSDNWISSNNKNIKNRTDLQFDSSKNKPHT